MKEPLNLKPRAIAVLVALRSEPRTRQQIRYAISDTTIRETMELLADMAESCALVGQVPGDERWYVAHAGIGWLEQRGLSVALVARLHVREDRASRLNGARP